MFLTICSDSSCNLYRPATERHSTAKELSDDNVMNILVRFDIHPKRTWHEFFNTFFISSNSKFYLIKTMINGYMLQTVVRNTNEKYLIGCKQTQQTEKPYTSYWLRPFSTSTPYHARSRLIKLTRSLLHTDHIPLRSLVL